MVERTDGLWMQEGCNAILLLGNLENKKNRPM
jgi:hypothetical protein